MHWIAASLLVFLFPLRTVVAQQSGLQDPYRVVAATGPVDAETGKASPSFADIDGDGLPDLIVGQFNGLFMIYRNVGTPGTPLFDDPEIMQADGLEARVPSG
ncbi:hypothetical protein ACFL6R_00205 [Gemmatimonadota bacterium]